MNGFLIFSLAYFLIFPSVFTSTLQINFLNAISVGSVREVKFYLDAGIIDINETILVDDIDQIISLINLSGFHASAMYNEFIPLIHAVNCGLPEIVEQLLCANANVNITDRFLSTPIHYASASGHADIMRILYQYGADVNAKDVYGYTPLHYIVENDHVEAVDLLLSWGSSSLNERNGYGMTPFELVRFDDDFVMGRKLFFSNFCSPDIFLKNNHGETILFSAVRSGHIDIVQLFLQYGLDVNDKNFKGMTCFHIACLHDDIEMVNFLFEHVESIDEVDNCKMTPLHHACINGSYHSGTFLLDHNASIDALDVSIWSPLHYACDMGSTKMISLLLRRGAKTNIRSLEGNCPLSLIPSRLFKFY